MGSMQNQLAKHKGAAAEIHSLRADVESLTNILDCKAKELETLTSRSTQQNAEIQKLQAVGTLMAFGAFSRNEVSNMVRSAALLSPIAYMGQMPSPLARAVADVFIAEALYWFRVHEFSPGGGAASKLVQKICTTIDCSNLESVITGPNYCLNSSRANLNRQEPTSTKNMIHLAQKETPKKDVWCSMYLERLWFIVFDEYHSRCEELLDLKVQGFYKEGRLQFVHHDAYQFIESLAPV